jgi:hypothetical protein
LIRFIGLIIGLAGVVFLLNPKAARSLIAFWEVEKRIYGLAGIRLVVAIIMFAGASKCAIPLVPNIMGILALISAIIIPVMGLEKSKQILKRWQEKPDKQWRLLSAIPIVMGILLLYAA